jgi:DNA-binding NarL/FixJ family response regulator
VFRRRAPAGPRSASGGLSSREREVARHVMLGETNREVAAALCLSAKTIESHLARIYDKLGVHSRAALVAIIGREEGSNKAVGPTRGAGRE